MKKLVALDRDVVVDLLTERLTFERTGVRLYEAILGRVETSNDGLVARAAPMLARIRFDEHEHATWLAGELESLGADPDGATPRSRLVERECEGIVQVVTAPHATPVELFHAIMTAELADHAGWNTLINLAAEVNDDEAQEALRRRLNEENEHLRMIRTIELALVRRELIGLETDVTRKAA